MLENSTVDVKTAPVRKDGDERIDARSYTVKKGEDWRTAGRGDASNSVARGHICLVCSSDSFTDRHREDMTARVF